MMTVGCMIEWNTIDSASITSVLQDFRGPPQLLSNADFLDILLLWDPLTQLTSPWAPS